MTDRREFLTAGAAALMASSAGARTRAPVRGAKDMLIVNALGGFPDPNARRQPGPIQNVQSRTIGDRLIADARASGMDAVNVTLGYVAGDMEPFEATIRDIGVWDARLRSRPAELVKVLTAADILRAHRERKIGIIYGFQNAAMVGTDVSRIDIFADLGVRIIQLTYNPANSIGSGSMAPGNGGITDFGRKVIDRLNQNRIMVDLSHSGEKTCLEAARISAQPISINHTGCRALTDLPRNKTDAELRLVAERGGFVGIYFMPFLNPTSVATAADVVAHIEHAIKICGEDHVGIGTDGGTTGVDNMAEYRVGARKEIGERKAAGIGARGENPETIPFVEDLSGPGQFRKLAGLLKGRGHSTARIEKIMGMNFVTYAQRIWGA
ncbi:MAG: membrane dipeptidase [Sphingomonadales bacterium]